MRRLQDLVEEQYAPGGVLGSTTRWRDGFPSWPSRKCSRSRTGRSMTSYRPSADHRARPAQAPGRARVPRRPRGSGGAAVDGGAPPGAATTAGVVSGRLVSRVRHPRRAPVARREDHARSAAHRADLRAARHAEHGFLGQPRGSDDVALPTRRRRVRASTSRGSGTTRSSTARAWGSAAGSTYAGRTRGTWWDATAGSVAPGLLAT